MGALRVLGVVVVLAGLAVGLGHWSGSQEPIDLHARAQEDSSVALQWGRVEIPGQGIGLHQIQAGHPDGRPVLMLHGFPEFWWSWRRQLVPLSRAGFRAIIPDLRGYNASDKPDDVEAYRMENMVADVVGLIAVLGYDSVYLVGHDWGAAVAWQVALRHPERVGRLLIFQGAHPHGLASVDDDEGSVRWFRSFFQIPVLPEFVARVGNWALLSRNLRNTSGGAFNENNLDPYRYAWDRDGAMRTMLHWYRAAARFPIDDSGDQIVRVPTRIVFGLDDPFIPASAARASLRFCTDAELVEVPGVGHWILQQEPELVTRQMIEFFGPR